MTCFEIRFQPALCWFTFSRYRPRRGLVVNSHVSLGLTPPGFRLTFRFADSDWMSHSLVVVVIKLRLDGRKYIQGHG